MNYAVKAGNTLWGISNQFGVSVTELSELNDFNSEYKEYTDELYSDYFLTRDITEKSVRKIQKYYGFEVNGIVGHLLWRKVSSCQKNSINIGS